MAIRLNEQQVAAVYAPPDKPVMVVASPGSGKTALLTMRVAHLIGDCDVNPGAMVVTTFTRKAADEMKERLQPMIGDAVSRLQIGTIHSICLRVLREEKLARDVIDSYDQKKIIQESLGYKGLNWDVGWRYPLGWIMKAKAVMVPPREAQDFFMSKLEGLCKNQWQAMDLSQKLAHVYRFYEDEKKNLGRMDFADMILWVAQRLRDNAEFRRRWQSRVDYVLCDEVQDTSNLAYYVLKTLAEPENRFFAVGDPDQELFRWSGADPDHNIFGFPKMYPDGLILPLEVNHRSTQSIVRIANECIKGNYVNASEVRQKFKKTLKPHPGAPEGIPIKVSRCADVEDEAQGIGEDIQAMIDAGREPKDIYVVYRVNSQSRAIEDVLLKTKIPYVVQGSLGFYDRKVIKDVVSYLALVNDEANDEAFQRVANIGSASFERPTHGFGSRWMQECTALARGHQTSMWQAMLLMKPRQQRFQSRGIDDLMDLVEGIRERSQKKPLTAISMVRAECYDAYLMRSEGVDEATAQEDGLFDDLEELGYAASQFETIQDFLAFVKEVREMQAERSKENVNAVVLTTIHRVKGLERPIVFGIGLSEGILPHRMAMGGNLNANQMPVENVCGVEDERCAAFVLVSRAKEELYLSYPMLYRNEEVGPSRFLVEMGLIQPEEAAEREEEARATGATVV